MIRICGNCGLGIAFPPISDKKASELYSEGEYWRYAGRNISTRVFPVPLGLAQARWKLIEQSLLQSKKVKDIKILDVGAGHGYIGLVATASRDISIARYDAVEADPSMRLYLQNMWKAWGRKQSLNVITSLEQSSDNYDVVVLSHILEHLPDPKSLLKSAMARTSANGLLFIDVPNQDYLFKPDVFPHVLFFSQLSLKFLLEAGHLEIVSIEGWGRNMFKSPLYPGASKSLKFWGWCAWRFRVFIPDKFMVSFYAWYFGVNSINTSGTWIRALCRQNR